MCEVVFVVEGRVDGVGDEVEGLTVSVDRRTRSFGNMGADKVPRLDMRGSTVASTCVPKVTTTSAISTSCLQREPIIQDMSAKARAELWNLI